MTHDSRPSADHMVRLFHASLVWPLQLEPRDTGRIDGRHWELFEATKDDAIWKLLDDEFTDDPSEFQERHYREFVAFLPHVQQFLYGEGRVVQGDADDGPGDSPIHVFRRKDIAKLRLTLRQGQAPIELKIVHVDLYFFKDLDLVQLNVEVRGDDLPLQTAREILYRFGHAYPSGWEESGAGLQNAYLAEWLGDDGQVMARSDAECRHKFLGHVCEYRSPNISQHWASLLKPLVLAHSAEVGALRFRLLEYHRMPAMAYLAVERPLELSREDWVRIGFATSLPPQEPLPLNDPEVMGFEKQYCQDRYWQLADGAPHTRFICTGTAFTVVGDASDAYFLDHERGTLAQFRHQYFMVFLIAHLHRAALLVFSQVLVEALNRLDVSRQDSVRRFKRKIRSNFETFLRFTHRYWFSEVSARPHTQTMFRMCAEHLNNAHLYKEVRDEIREMSEYLDSDNTRRQSNTVLRLTVVSVLGLIATVTTGYFGMNIIPFGDGPVEQRVVHGVVATLGFVVLVFYSVAKAKRLSDFLEALSDEHLSLRGKLQTLWRVFYRKEASRPADAGIGLDG